MRLLKQARENEEGKTKRVLATDCAWAVAVQPASPTAEARHLPGEYGSDGSAVGRHGGRADASASLWVSPAQSGGWERRPSTVSLHAAFALPLCKQPCSVEAFAHSCW